MLSNNGESADNGRVVNLGQSHEATMAVKQLKRLRREVSNSSRESEGDKSEVSQDKTKRIRIQGSDEGEHDSKSDHGRESIVPQRRRGKPGSLILFRSVLKVCQPQ